MYSSKNTAAFLHYFKHRYFFSLSFTQTAVLRAKSHNCRLLSMGP